MAKADVTVCVWVFLLFPAHALPSAFFIAERSMNMNQTTNYKLNLPEGRDIADISKLNDNFTKLDSQLKSTDNRVTTVDSRVTTVDNRVTSVNSSLTSSINSTKTSLTSSINNVSTQRKPVTGTYTGNGSASRSFSLGVSALTGHCLQ